MNFFPASPGLGAAEMAIRPEDVRLGDVPGAIALAGIVRKCTFLGREAQLLIETPLGPLLMRDADPTPELLASSGQEMRVCLPRDRIALFDASGKRV